MPQDPPAEILALVLRMMPALKRFAVIEPKFFVEQREAAPLSPAVRWWRGPGWGLVRTKAGDWIGMPIGLYTHPPLTGMIYPNATADLWHQVADGGGFVLPAEHPHAARVELMLLGFKR